MQPIFPSKCHWADIVNRIKKSLAALGGIYEKGAAGVVAPLVRETVR